ncbi:Uncharacterized protein APZ42_031143 [Daphnia magna]|uniref:Reverse transcriptase domain-containing protein n=1 Tax=Daphnia magna TaxID=35525 RepID=A0A164N3Q6_9CRUS|nr:Uncharacterized protein APZ42_031143 [Daphnia magna]
MALGTLEEITLDWEGTDNVGEVVALAALETPKWSREEFGSGACDCDRGLPTNPTESLLKYVGKAGTNAGTGSGDRGRWSNRKLQWPLEFTSGAGDQFKVMTFGLCVAPVTFQRMMDLVLSGLKWSAYPVYSDEIIIYSRTVEEHVKILQRVFECLKGENLKVKLKKWLFTQARLQALGGNFWGGDEQDGSFKARKDCLIDAAQAAYLDYGKPFDIQPYACEYGIRAELVEKTGEGKRLVAFASRLLSTIEQNFSIFEKECIALVWEIKKFNCYIWGMTVRVVTDHHALCW